MKNLRLKFDTITILGILRTPNGLDLQSEAHKAKKTKKAVCLYLSFNEIHIPTSAAQLMFLSIF